MTDTQEHPLQLITPATRADFRRLVAPLAETCWPEFMLHDPVADKYWGDLFERFSDYQYGLLDTVTGKAAALGNSVPLHWDASLADLPEEGWDWAMEQAVQDHASGTQPTLHCAIQVAIDPAYRGRGVSTRMVLAMREIGIARGFSQLIAPVRPSQKAQYPLADIDHYVQWKDKDGLPFDAWLRVHARTGASIIKVCHRSMEICGTTDEWQAWTGMSFPEDGPYYVPGGLNPVQAKGGTVDYVEPNVWMLHPLR